MKVVVKPWPWLKFDQNKWLFVVATIVQFAHILMDKGGEKISKKYFYRRWNDPAICSPAFVRFCCVRLIQSDTDVGWPLLKIFGCLNHDILLINLYGYLAPCLMNRTCFYSTFLCTETCYFNTFGNFINLSTHIIRENIFNGSDLIKPA